MDLTELIRAKIGYRTESLIYLSIGDMIIRVTPSFETFS